MNNQNFLSFQAKLSRDFKNPKRLSSPNYNNLSLYTNFIEDYHIPEFRKEQNLNYLDLRSIQDKDWAIFLVSQGLDLANSNDYDKAVKKYDSALDLDHECISAWIAKGIALANTRLYKDAIRHFKKAMEIDPNHRKAQELLLKTRNFYDKLKAERESAYNGVFLISTEYDSKLQSEKNLQLANDLFL